MNKGKNKILAGKRLYIFLFFIAVLAGSGLFYYFYWMRTPQYAVKIVADAVSKHDTETFYKYVDVDSVLDGAYDDYFTVYFAEDPFMSKNPIKNFAAVLVKMAKPLAVSEMKKKVDYYVKTGNWQEENTGQDNNEAAALTGKNSDITGLAAIKDMHFQKIKFTKKESDKAIVGLAFTEDGEKDETVINIKMEKQADGVWKVVSIDNMKEYAEKIIARKASKEG
ncbi:hypothetical protein [Pectinatus cerevisiiphilus]|uniref:DUF2939 family protein n=1 Tax=Pectinatus cerevisiiphilus TaxID=86956 RepID=A0A4R3KF47_9FIRM|nr:hypothetical protein [Pectinatus cerevisiiphilus]TCS81888.1 hypothetical protein EDC37_10159 [Pectinatus cerevisiiphilus]